MGWARRDEAAAPSSGSADYTGHRLMAEMQGGSEAAGEARGEAGRREKGTAVVSLLTGALVWGVIWYPYRELRDAGVGGIFATTLTPTPLPRCCA